MSILFFETVIFTPVALAEPEASAATMAVAADAKKAGEDTVKISTALVDETEFRPEVSAGNETVVENEAAVEKTEATSIQTDTEKKEMPAQAKESTPAKKANVVRTLKKIDGEVSWVGIKSMALNYQDEVGNHEFDSIFPFDKKLTLIGYDSILDITPGDPVHVQYEEAVEDPGSENENVFLTLKSVKRIRTEGEGK